MGSDKSFDTLLNKYNILLAQTRDLKEQLKNYMEAKRRTNNYYLNLML